KSKYEEDILIKRISGFLPSKNIRVPHGEREIAMIHRPRLVAQPKIMFVLGHGLPNFEGGTFCGVVKDRWPVGLVLRDHVARCVLEDNPQRRFFNADNQGTRIQRYALRGVLNLEHRNRALKRER